MWQNSVVLLNGRKADYITVRFFTDNLGVDPLLFMTEHYIHLLSQIRVSSDQRESFIVGHFNKLTFKCINTNCLLFKKIELILIIIGIIHPDDVIHIIRQHKVAYPLDLTIL